MHELILSERQITDEVTDNLQLSHGSAYAVIYNKLGFHKVYIKWILKQLTEENKRKSMDRRNLDIMENEASLERTVNGDKTWIHQNSIISWKREAHGFLGFSRANIGALRVHSLVK